MKRAKLRAANDVGGSIGNRVLTVVVEEDEGGGLNFNFILNSKKPNQCQKNNTIYNIPITP